MITERLDQKIAREHVMNACAKTGYRCTCGAEVLASYYGWREHIATVTETAVREQVVRDIEAYAARFDPRINGGLIGDVLAHVIELARGDA